MVTFYLKNICKRALFPGQLSEVIKVTIITADDNNKSAWTCFLKLKVPKLHVTGLRDESKDWTEPIWELEDS